MKILNTSYGKVKIRKKLLALVLSLSTTLTLTGCSEERAKKELEIIKFSYTSEQLNKPTKLNEKLKKQTGNSKAIFHIYDSFYGHDIKNPEKDQLEKVTVKITDSDNSVVDIFTTETNKEYMVKNLTTDEYTLEIVNIPDEYDKPTELYSFTIENTKKIENNSIYTINYIDIPLENKTDFLEYKPTDLKDEGIDNLNGVVVVSSVDEETNDYVAGGRYAIIDNENNTIISWFATYKSFIVTNLNDGEYTIEEIQSSDEYYSNIKERYITIKDGKVYSDGIENREIVFTVNQKKERISSKKLIKTK